tara:strand:+ start:25094 stop:25810 length:717 start_codon:yes stop_codon:yes gene_type:complete
MIKSTNKPLAIVTGASTGLGKKISIDLAEKQFHVVMISRNEKKLKEVEQEILSKNFICSLICADISDVKSLKLISSKINLENVEVLVNNAGIGIFNKIQNISISEWDNQINTNLRGSFLMTKLVVDSMINKKNGKIVFINSVAGINPYPNSTAYVASKYGLRGFASSLREELRSENIKVISIHPGATNTSFWDKVEGEFPVDEMLSIDDVSEAVVNSIIAKGNTVFEEIVVRRTAGDF